MKFSEKNLSLFLAEAVGDKIINPENEKSLNAFFKEKYLPQNSWITLTTILGGAAAFVISLGVFLVIASYWGSIGDTFKMAGLLVFMVLSHVLGVFSYKKGYEKTAITLHAVGCGFIYAGIGLMAQIFGLEGDISKPLLIYAVLVLPLAVFLKSELIFTSVFISAVAAYYNLFPEFYFVTTSAFIVFFAGYLFKLEYTKWATCAGFLAFLGMLYALGFAHNWNGFVFRSVSLNTHVYLCLALCWGFWLAFVLNKKHLISWFCLPSLLLITFIPFASEIYKNQMDTLSFGNYLVSILASISYFSVVGGSIYKGVLEGSSFYVNWGVFFFGIGVFTRFLDVMSSAMSLGQSFIFLGIVFLLMSYYLEKWRKKLLTIQVERD